MLPDGRIRAVVQFSRWTETPAAPPPARKASRSATPDSGWSGRRARRRCTWPAPYPGDHHNPLALSPDGSKLLVVRPLQPDGVQVELPRAPCRGPPPPPPTPVSGPVAELIDIAEPAGAVARVRARGPILESGLAARDQRRRPLCPDRDPARQQPRSDRADRHAHGPDRAKDRAHPYRVLQARASASPPAGGAPGWMSATSSSSTKCGDAEDKRVAHRPLMGHGLT